ncbi:MAG: hypothetical protein COC01_08245 [Bacteroidetes bacterium]|nr:MAG: hypothetical protein COC01_08245 [Bacteroidota bacterium]
MKRFSILLLAVIFCLPFSGCKKGEEDPGISFKSRDGRVKGIWKLTKITETSTDVDKTTVVFLGVSSSSVTTTTITVDYDGTDMTKTDLVTTEASSTTVNDVTTTVTTYSLTVTINKDNTYSYSLDKTDKEYCTSDASTCTTFPSSNPVTYTEDEDGEWYWDDANDKKIHLKTYAPYFSGKLKKCSSSELIFESTWDESDKTTYTDYVNEGTYTGTSTYTWTKQ